MLVLAGAEGDAAAATARLERSIASGAALAKFRELLEAQGGDPRVVDEPSRLPQARARGPLPSPAAGFVQRVDAMGVALAALRLGAGRARAEDSVDHAVGLTGLVKVGDRVARGGPLCVVHSNDDRARAEAEEMLRAAIAVGDAPARPAPLVGEVIG